MQGNLFGAWSVYWLLLAYASVADAIQPNRIPWLDARESLKLSQTSVEGVESGALSSCYSSFATMKVRKFFLRLLFLPGINRFVDKRWLSMMYMRELNPKDIMALRLKAYNEIQAMIALHGKSEELLANTLAELKVQSKPRPDGGVTLSCSCGARGYSADRRGHWADVLIRDMNAIRDMKDTPESWRERGEAIFMAIDDALARAQQ